jgi:mannose-6-phosphate isomerase-like protein (cupin superfamily)
MKLRNSSLAPIDFEGLKIIGYTSARDLSSSMAEITVPTGIKHRKAYSKRSDKYYYVVAGQLEFTVDEESFDLASGDVCVVLKGQRFSYQNDSGKTAKLILVHTPSFDLDYEVFET